MSVKIIACLNPTSNDRTEFQVGPGPIKDIITSLNTGFSTSQARVSRNGEIVKDFSVKANDGDTLWIKFVPHGSPQEAGLGMKIGGWALAVVGGILVATGYGSAIGVMLIGAGIGMITGGTVLMNLNIPTFNNKDHEKPENDPSIRGGRNQARPHGRIPVLFGRHRLYPDIAANPYTEIIDGKQYLVQLLCGGCRDYVIDINSFKLSEIPVTDLSRTKNIASILSGADPVVRIEILQNGEASSVYPYCVHEDPVTAPLKNITDEGLSGAVIRSTPDNTDAIDVDIFFQNGLGRYNDGGDLVTASVEVRAWYKKTGDPDSAYTLMGYFNNGSNVISGADLKTKRLRIRKTGLAPGGYTVKIERVTPDSADFKVSDQVYVGSIRSIKSVRPVRAERQKDLTIIALRLMATGQLNNIVDRFNYVATAKLPVWSAGGSGRLYWLNAAETRNPASALLYALQGRAVQQSVDPDDVDWPSLEAFYMWCEEHEYTCDAYLAESVTIAELIRMIGSTSRADILRIDSKISVVQDIERPSPVQLFTPKNTISYSIAMFNADVPDAVSLRFIDGDAGYAQNEVQVFNTPDGNRVKEPESVQKIDLWGVTNSVQARRIGMYNYGCLKNRPFVHTIEVDIEYLLCNKGDWVQYAGDIALTGSVQGRITGIIWADGVCVGIDTDEPVVMEEGKQYAVRIRKSNGTVILKNVIFSRGIRHTKSIEYFPGCGAELWEPFIGVMYPVDEDNVYWEPQYLMLFEEPLEAADAPEVNDIYAFGVRGYEVLDLVITDIRPEQNLSAVLTCVEYSPEIFGVDYPGFVLPEFENKITPVSGAVDSGIVNPDRWKLFAVYHDSEEEPERPTGDGQSGGWHYVQTFRSVWQSTKMAESMESGEWGLPIRIKAERGYEDVTPIWLSLAPQNITLETDGDGKVLAGLLPLTVQARLHRWNSVLSDVAFSLPAAPAGVSVNSNGVITAGADAVLDDENSITVRAEFQGGVYTAALKITKNINNSAPRYLGTVQTIPYTGAVTIEQSWDWVEFRLYDGENLLDAERVMILSETGDKLIIDLSQDSVSIQCDEYGEPKEGELPVKIRAEAYIGTKLVDNNSGRYKKQIIPYPSTGPEIFSPPIGIGLYPVSTDDESVNVIKWELENAPTGITIDRDGVIEINGFAGLDKISEITVRCIDKSAETFYRDQIIPYPSTGPEIFSPIGNFPVSSDYKTSEKVLTVRKVLDSSSKVVMNINNDHETFIFDKYGKIFANQLPFSTQVALYKGTKTINHSGIRWSLEILNIDKNYTSLINNAKSSITLSNGGAITISQNLPMTGSIEIDVCAEYSGVVYSKNFIIKMVQMPDTETNGVPRYLGKTYTVTNSNIVLIHFTDNNQNKVAAVIGDYIAYVGPDEPGASHWKKNYCLRWTGNGWEQLDPLSSPNTDYYMRAFRDITDGAGMGVFSALLVRKIMAMEATIDELTSKTIKLHDGGVIQSQNYDLSQPEGQRQGFIIKANGDVEFNSGVFRGILAAANIRVTGRVRAGYNYVLRANNISVSTSRTGTWCSLKSITTAARGSAYLRFDFYIGISYGVRYRIYVNNELYYERNMSQETNVEYIDFYESGVSTVRIDVNLASPGGRPVAGPIVYVERFELLVMNDPGLLAFLG